MKEIAFLKGAIGDGWIPESDATLRLARRIPWVVDGLAERVDDDIRRALLGLGAPDPAGRDLADRIRLAVAETDGGAAVPVSVAAQLEEEAQASGRIELCVQAARIHAQVNVGREASARMALSEQSLPYVFPGDVHPLMIDVLACGERILPALHVDWIRKLTGWLAPALAMDCAHQGLWFWPILDVLDSKKLSREFRSMAAKPMKKGSRGQMAAYGSRLALDIDPGDDRQDRTMMALAVVGDAAG